MAMSTQKLMADGLIRPLKDHCDHAMIRFKAPKNYLSPKTWISKKDARVLLLQELDDRLYIFRNVSDVRAHLLSPGASKPELVIMPKQVQVVLPEGGEKMLIEFRPNVDRHPLKIRFLVKDTRDAWQNLLSEWSTGKRQIGGVDRNGTRVVKVDRKPFGMKTSSSVKEPRLVVTEVSGRAAELGVAVGDVITQINKSKIDSHDDMRKAFKSLHMPFIMRLKPAAGDAKAASPRSATQQQRVTAEQKRTAVKPASLEVKSGESPAPEAEGSPTDNISKAAEATEFNDLSVVGRKLDFTATGEAAGDGKATADSKAIADGKATAEAAADEEAPADSNTPADKSASPSEETKGKEVKGLEIVGSNAPADETEGKEIKGLEVVGAVPPTAGSDAPAEDTEGKEVAGLGLQGASIPAQETEGKEIKGLEVVGTEPPTAGPDAPAEETEGREVAGLSIEGTSIPTEEREGKELKGLQVIGTNIPSPEFEGKEIPGLEVVGSNIPTEETGGKEIEGLEIVGKAVDVPPEEDNLGIEVSGLAVFEAGGAVQSPTKSPSKPNPVVGNGGGSAPIQVEPMSGSPVSGPQVDVPASRVMRSGPPSPSARAVGRAAATAAAGPVVAPCRSAALTSSPLPPRHETSAALQFLQRDITAYADAAPVAAGQVEDDSSDDGEELDARDTDEEEEQENAEDPAYWRRRYTQYRQRYKKLSALHERMRQVSRRSPRSVHSILEVESQTRVETLQKKLRHSQKLQTALAAQSARQQQALDALESRSAARVAELEERLRASEDGRQRAEAATRTDKRTRTRVNELERAVEQHKTSTKSARGLLQERSQQIAALQKNLAESKKKSEGLSIELAALRGASRAKDAQIAESDRKAAELTLKVNKMSERLRAQGEQIVELEVRSQLADRELKAKDERIQRLDQFVQQASKIKNAREKAVLASRMIEACFAKMDDLRKCNAELAQQLEKAQHAEQRDRERLRKEVLEPINAAKAILSSLEEQGSETGQGNAVRNGLV